MGLPIRKLPSHEWEQPARPAERPALRLVENLPAPQFIPVERQTNWRSLGTSTLVHTAGIILFMLVSLLATEQISVTKRYNTIDLAPLKPVKPYQPPAPKVKLPPPPPLPRLRELPPPPPKTVKLEPPKIEPPKIEPQIEPPKIVEKAPVIPPPPVAPKRVQPANFDAKLAEPGPKHDKPAPRTDMFSGSSAKPTLPAMDPKKVQTGGFGDPNGLPGKGDPNRGVQIAQLGRFDLPQGPGYGNGGGGAKGVRGIIPSAGFGNGIATAGGGGSNVEGKGRGGVVQPGGFSDATAPVAQSPRTQPRAAEPAATQVEITFKPKPAYTDEARQMKIEGEALLDVTFLSSGQVRVLNVRRGLGHGLDEAAVRAAEQIRFKPARTRSGVPVDSIAVVHILFQLAY